MLRSRFCLLENDKVKGAVETRPWAIDGGGALQNSRTRGGARGGNFRQVVLRAKDATQRAPPQLQFNSKVLLCPAKGTRNYQGQFLRFDSNLNIYFFQQIAILVVHLKFSKILKKI